MYQTGASAIGQSRWSMVDAMIRLEQALKPHLAKLPN
jgi:hypothetical protein